MTLVCYFYKPTQDTAGPVLGGRGSGYEDVVVVVVGDGDLV